MKHISDEELIKDFSYLPKRGEEIYVPETPGNTGGKGIVSTVDVDYKGEKTYFVLVNGIKGCAFHWEKIKELQKKLEEEFKEQKALMKNSDGTICKEFKIEKVERKERKNTLSVSKF